MSDSKTSDAAVVTKEGSVASATSMQGGGVLLSPLPLNGGRKRRSSKKSRRASKKIAKALKKLGGEELEQVAGEVEEMGEQTPTEGARRRRSKKGGRKHTKRHTRRSRRGLYF